MLSVLLVTQIYLIISIQYYSHVKTIPMHQTGCFPFSLKKNSKHLIRGREEILDKRKVCYGTGREVGRRKKMLVFHFPTILPQVFTKSWSSESVRICFGLTEIYGRNSLPLYDDGRGMHDVGWQYDHGTEKL
jgi:hypothetical protein